jgi:hypothetical protein
VGLEFYARIRERMAAGARDLRLALERIDKGVNTL